MVSERDRVRCPVGHSLVHFAGRIKTQAQRQVTFKLLTLNNVT